MIVYQLIDCVFRSLGVVVCVFNHRNARHQYHASVAAIWTAQFEFKNESVSHNINSNPINGCGHLHTRVIEFPCPFTETPLKALITTSTGWKSDFIPVSYSEPSGNYFLVGYTAITEKFFYDEDKNVRYVKQLFVLIEWINYHLMIGFDHLSIYLDLDDPHYDFVSFMRTGLSSLIGQDKVSMQIFVTTRREGFYFQQAFGMHCLERFRAKAKWFASFDVDEYFEVRNAINIADAIKKISRKSENSTIQVLSQFWSRPDNICWSVNISSFTVKMEGYIQEGHEKCIFNLEKIKYYSVHMPTNPLDTIRPSPDLELRLNHYKRFGCIMD